MKNVGMLWMKNVFFMEKIPSFNDDKHDILFIVNIPDIILSPDVKDTAFSDVRPSHPVQILFSFLLIDILGYASLLPTANCIP